MKLPNNARILKMIYEFREQFDQPIVKFFNDYNHAQAALYGRLIAEELNEYEIARSRVDRLDAIGDLTYVIFGAAASTGVPPYAYKGVWLKANPAYKMPLPATSRLVNILSNPHPKLLPLINAITNAYYEMEQAAAVAGVKLLPLVEEIHFSNMSKLWTAHEVEELPSEFVATKKGANYLVKRKADGKVIKSPSYRPPSLENF